MQTLDRKDFKDLQHLFQAKATQQVQTRVLSKLSQTMKNLSQLPAKDLIAKIRITVSKPNQVV
jgi:hypothetical protein